MEILNVDIFPGSVILIQVSKGFATPRRQRITLPCSVRMRGQPSELCSLASVFPSVKWVWLNQVIAEVPFYSNIVSFKNWALHCLTPFARPYCQPSQRRYQPTPSLETAVSQILRFTVAAMTSRFLLLLSTEETHSRAKFMECPTGWQYHKWQESPNGIKRLVWLVQRLMGG